jgi:3-deoxy-manno-octulosonate cytidylyltransferase (CMP-KDO synthetase)
VVKVVRNVQGEALYFSRQAIPFLRDLKPDEWLKKAIFFKHVGIYAYRVDVLKQIALLESSVLETSENLEQLRWLENGYKIKLGITDYEGIGVDTPDDLAKLINNACE